MMNNDASLFDCLQLDDLSPVSPTPSSSSSSSGGSGSSASLVESVSFHTGKEDLISASLSQSGILFPDGAAMQQETPWDGETEDFLNSILTGNSSDVEKLALDPDLSMNMDVLEVDRPFSDTSSDSGCNLEQIVTSPEVIMFGNVGDGMDNMNRAMNDSQSDDEDEPLQAVNPMTNSPPECTTITIPRSCLTSNSQRSSLLQNMKAAIVLPNMNGRQKKTQLICTAPPTSKRRRVSASSSDSGLDETVSSHTTTIYTEGSDSLSPAATRTRTTITTLASPSNSTQINIGGSQPSSSGGQQKYPQLLLNEEEKRLCERENIKLPSHYPLSREEEKNLKRIRRKIRNKVSAQDSRKRKKEYVDAMEDRVRICSDENSELHKKMELLESQNKTLAGQVKRLHQIIVNGGMLKNTQTSTAMMVLLLSTALFLLPGLKNQTSDAKCELDISQAIKMPPMPGQSRSLLQFNPTGIKQEYPASPVEAPNMMQQAIPQNVVVRKATDAMAANANSAPADHDYIIMKGEPELAPSTAAVASATAKSVLLVGGGMLKAEDAANNSYIEEDAPPQGYGPGKMVEERRINVTRGGSRQGMRTVVLHVPKDIK